jgi:hypothetical protein
MTTEPSDIATLNNKPLEEWRPSAKHIPADPDRWIEEVNRAASLPAKPRPLTKSILAGFQKYYEALAPRN